MKRREIRIFVLILVSAIFSILFFQTSDNALAEENNNNPPVLGIDFAYTTEVGQEIIFDASQSFDPDGDEIFVLWDFGNGVQKQGTKVSHIYNSTGQYNVQLSITDSYNFTSVGILVSVVEKKSKPEMIDYSNEIILNEILPNPEGSDNAEWIELFNKSSQTVNLDGWSLRDASGRTYIIDSSDFIDIYIEGRGFFIIPRSVSSIALNNNGDVVELLNPSKAVVDSVVYDTKAQDNTSFARNNTGDWQWTEELTKGEKNIFQKQVKIVDMSDSVLQTNTNVKNTDTLDDREVEAEVVKQSQYATSGRVIITELLPSPDGDDRDYEFVELYNADDFVVDVTNWRLEDKRDSYILSGTIEPDEYMVLERRVSGIVLNNAGDSIVLKNSLGIEVDRVEYNKSKQANTYSLSSQDNKWYWTDIATPGEINEFIVDVSDNQDLEVKVLGFSETIINTIGDIYNLSKGESVVVQGIVTALPGEIDNRIMYIQDETGGIQVYMHSAIWSDIELGDVVEVSGEISQAYGEYRIKVKSEDDIKFITSSPSVEPFQYNCSQDQLDIGVLTTVKGVVANIKKPYIELGMDCGVDNIFIRFENDTLSEIELGDILNIVGIIRVRSDKIFLHALSFDILSGKVPKLSNNDLSQPQQIVIDSQEEQQGLPLLVLYTGIVVMIGFVGIVLYFKRNPPTSSL